MAIIDENRMFGDIFKQLTENDILDIEKRYDISAIVLRAIKNGSTRPTILIEGKVREYLNNKK